jgi:hypothetical protein
MDELRAQAIKDMISTAVWLIVALAVAAGVYWLL